MDIGGREMTRGLLISDIHNNRFTALWDRQVLPALCFVVFCIMCLLAVLLLCHPQMLRTAYQGTFLTPKAPNDTTSNHGRFWPSRVQHG